MIGKYISLHMQNNLRLLASSHTIVNILKEFYILQTKSYLTLFTNAKLSLVNDLK